MMMTSPAHRSPRLRRGLRLSLLSVVVLASLACLTPVAPTLVSPAAAPGAQGPLLAGQDPSDLARPAETQNSLVLDIADPQAQEQEPICAQVTADSLHVRIAGSVHAKTIGWFYKGATLHVIAMNLSPLDPTSSAGADWWKVIGEGIDDHSQRVPLTGFVNSSFLEETQCSNNDPP